MRERKKKLELNNELAEILSLDQKNTQYKQPIEGNRTEE